MKKHNQRAEIAALRWIVVRLAASELRRAPLPKRHRGASGVEWRKCTVRRGGVPPSARREAAAKQRVAWSGVDIGISLCRGWSEGEPPRWRRGGHGVYRLCAAGKTASQIHRRF